MRFIRVIQSPPRILIVDDEPLVLHLLVGHLERAGYQTTTAANGEEGLRKFKEDEWSLVITDKDMPKLGGEEMARAMKAISPTTPIILLTGSGVIAGNPLFHAALEKPFRRHELLNVVQGIVGVTDSSGDSRSAKDATPP